MRNLRRRAWQNEIVLIIVIALIGVALSAAAYQYSSMVANNIDASSVKSIQTNTQIQASDMDHILLNQFNTISSNLQILAVSHAVQIRNASEAIPLFDAAVASTIALAHQYYWIDQHGNLLLARNETGSISAVLGANLTQRPYFIGAKEAGTVYYSGLTQNLLNQSVINIAVPIYSQDGAKTFEGVIGTGIYLPAMGAFLQSQISPQLKSSIGLLDSRGTILFSNDQKFLGENIFGSSVQSLLPLGLKQTFDAFITISLEGQAGVGEISYSGSSSTIAYQPILIPSINNQTKPQMFGVLYITSPDVLAANQADQIGQLRLLTGVVVAGIGALSVAAAAVILRWNRRLDTAVKQRTFDLVVANEELRQRTEALARANTEIASQADTQRDLLNITAHELRTPTQSILANAELMHDALRPLLDTSGAISPQSSSVPGMPSSPVGGRSSQFSDTEFANLASSTYRNAQRLQKLIQNILNVVRIENKSLRLEVETFDLNEKIMNVIGDTRNIVESGGRRYSEYNIVFDPQDSPLHIRADMVKVYEILSNLLRNAVIHSKESGTITVTAKPSDGFAVVSVRDEGTGIDPELLPRLFTKFATKTGTGLGLFISKNYVEALGGKIWAQNNENGRGATFTFTLPLDGGTETTVTR